ncbi:TSUP family transporter [Aeromonas caviae]
MGHHLAGGHLHLHRGGHRHSGGADHRCRHPGAAAPLPADGVCLLLLLLPQGERCGEPASPHSHGVRPAGGRGRGLYDGFFGPGTGSFFAIGFVALAGFGMARATAHTKLLNFTSNIASLLFFTLGARWCGAWGCAWRWGSSSGRAWAPSWCSRKG